MNRMCSCDGDVGSGTRSRKLVADIVYTAAYWDRWERGGGRDERRTDTVHRILSCVYTNEQVPYSSATSPHSSTIFFSREPYSPPAPPGYTAAGRCIIALAVRAVETRSAQPHYSLL